MSVLFRYNFVILISLLIFFMISKMSALIGRVSIDGRIMPMCDFRHFSHFWYFGSISLLVCLFFSIGINMKKTPPKISIFFQFSMISFLVLILPSNYYRFADHSLVYQFFNRDNPNLEITMILLLYLIMLIWAFDTIIQKTGKMKRRMRNLLSVMLSLVTITLLLLLVAYAFSLFIPRVKAHGYYNGFFYHAWEHCISGLGVSLMFTIGLYQKTILIWKRMFFQYCCIFFIVLVIPYFYSMMQMPAYIMQKVAINN